jgi:cob(I)alamin adenosyltransferase
MFGGRVSKHHPQIEAVGALDEFNVALGAVKLAGGQDDLEFVDWVQSRLLGLMGEVGCDVDGLDRYLASTLDRINETDVAVLDLAVESLERESVKPERGWIQPGVNALELAYSLARVAARRAERRMIATELPLRDSPRHFINRLSDVLWLRSLRAAVTGKS